MKKEKNQKSSVSTASDKEEDINGGGNNNYKQSSSSCCSEEDDSNGSSQEINGGTTTSSLSSKGKAALNVNGKTRANRGAATDPQSLYARVTIFTYYVFHIYKHMCSSKIYMNKFFALCITEKKRKDK